ncbi:MAG: GC-type dockerin domain-anchored protein [Phycisphaerales bacterium JB052]
MKNFSNVLIASSMLACAAGAQGSVLTFMIDGLGNFNLLPQAYGDRVVAIDDGDFHYDEQGEGFTPNVVTSYTDSIGQTPAYWSTGYGDLVDVYFEDADGIGSGEIVLTADYGYEVVLYGFDAAAYSSAFASDPTIDAVRVMGCASTPLFEELDAVISETTRTTYDFSSAPLQARELRIQFESGNLGNLSDDICLDNIRFGQVAVDPVAIACPSDYAAPICELNFFDVSAFLSLYNNADPMADLNGDGDYNFFDVSMFLSEYAAGCNED